MSSFSLQVSAEPDGSSYVFQGFIQGKDYGQFGLQRLGNSVLAPNNECASFKSVWIVNYNFKKSDELLVIRELLFAGRSELIAHAESALQ